MTIVRGLELGRELIRTHNEIDRSIKQVKEDAREGGMDPFKLRDTQGNYILAPLLAAKAQMLHGLVLVNQPKK